ncbi:hypothetical protein ACU8KH_05560 [Lachancea thermotolerans]
MIKLPNEEANPNSSKTMEKANARCISIKGICVRSDYSDVLYQSR